MTAWSDGYWESRDGLRLHYRDYAGGDGRPPILCIPGLTRNARDFEGVAERLAGAWRLICVDLRGRGESAYAKDSASYNPATYVEDLEDLISSLALERFILFGTSLGGILTMLLAQRCAGRLEAALINDIGSVIESQGIDYIRSYVGRQQNWQTWLHAARALREAQEARYPDWTLDQWITHAHRVCRLTSTGRVVFDYDMRIAEPFRLPGAGVDADLWPAFLALKDVPTLLVRGALSDLLSEQTTRQMAERHPKLELVTVPRVGHAPTLDEPVVVAAIERLLARVAR